MCNTTNGASKQYQPATLRGVTVEFTEIAELLNLQSQQTEFDRCSIGTSNV
jgi:hypothetical protein